MEDILTFFADQPGWAWLIVAVILFVLDVLAPGFYMVWFGLAAAAVGVLVFAVPMETNWQILAFCGACVIFLMIGRALWSGEGHASDKPLLNQRARQLIGRTFALTAPNSWRAGADRGGRRRLDRAGAGSSGRGDGAGEGCRRHGSDCGGGGGCVEAERQDRGGRPGRALRSIAAPRRGSALVTTGVFGTVLAWP